MDETSLNGAQDDRQAAEMARSADSRSAALAHELGCISVLSKRVTTGLGSDAVLSMEALEELLVVLDGDDAMLAFVAMQSLRATLLLVQDQQVAYRCIKSLLTSRPDCAKASRFQLLRQLIKPRKDQPDAKGLLDSDEEGSEAEDSGVDSPHESYPGGLLAEFRGFVTLFKRALDQPSTSFDRTNEALGCLQDIAKLVLREETPMAEVEVTELILWAVVQASEWEFNNGDRPMPTFLACSLIDLLVVSQPLYHAREAPWLPIALHLVKPSGSIAVLVLHLLQDVSADADGCCADSFVSPTSSYPLLQKWIHLCGVAAVEALQNPELLAQLTSTDRAQWIAFAASLPNRARLLAVLTEQDDTMVDVLLLLLQISSAIDDRQTGFPVDLTRLLQEQIDPHLLFADLLGIFGDDHLVILDMLMSSETRMLEYASHYLRLATSTWARTLSQWHVIGRKDTAMAVLIRLRLEMERLVAAGVFPYNPRPLLRRLEMLEEIYENQ